MNYNEFIKSVNEKLATMSEKEKTKWIYNIARTASEHDRVKLLNSLDGEKEYRPATYNKDELEEWCKKVEDAEIYFECSGYEEYGQNYWDNDFVYEYYDPFEIENKLSSSFQVAENLLFQKEYMEASVLYDLLLSLSFSALDIDAEEWSEMGIEEVIDNEILSIDIKRIILNVMYLIFQTETGRERAEDLYNYLTWNISEHIKIEEIFIMGAEELLGIDSFMEEWIYLLKDKDGDRPGELLLEACLYQGGISRLCEVARVQFSRHPVLYKYACEHLLNENKDLECEKLGLEAISLIPENLIIRGEIAEITSKTAAQLKHQDIVEECYKVAFYSYSTLNNYLRLFGLPYYENIIEKATKHAETLPVSESSMSKFDYYNKQMRENNLSKDLKDVIRFFNGEFEYIYDKCINDKSTLGWSSEFKGIGVPLFILLLNKDKKTTKAGERLINSIIYRVGFVEDIESFSNKFLNWKEKQVLAEERREEYIEWLKQEVEKRAEAVVGGGYRKSYYKAAILIATLGETLESNGMTSGRAVTIERYKKIHSRKRAFKAEFESFNE